MNRTSCNADISVLIPLRNEVASIVKLFDSMAQQNILNELRVEYLIIDGDSDDGTFEGLQQLRASGTSTEKSRISVQRNPFRITSVALNIGIGVASGDIIIRWDAHTEYAPDYIGQCVRVLHETGAWNVGGPARTKASGYVQRAVAAAYHSPFSVGGARFHNIDYAGYVDTVTYGCWKKQTLLDLGGFDEELVRNQDDELNLRIIRAGGTIYQSPDIKSWYHPRSSLTALFRQYLQYGYWKVRVIRKHHMPASPRHLVPVLFVLGLAIGPVLGVFSPLLLTAYFGVLASYLLALVAFSIQAARLRGWDILPVLPLTFLTYHLSYGIGFIAGVVDALFRKNSASTSTLFSGLSR